MGRPLFESVLRRAPIDSRASVLDMGCGAGLFCALAAARGALVAGVDAAAAFVAIAQARVPDGDFRLGEIEVLPYEDDAFDVVTSFNSLQFAANPVKALTEASRVAKPGATVATTIWAKPELSEATVLLTALRTLLPPPPRAPGPFALSADGTLEALVEEAGLILRSIEEIACPFEYPDLHTALRGVLSAGPAVKAIQISGEARVREVLATAMASFRLPSGEYRLQNTFRILFSTA